MKNLVILISIFGSAAFANPALRQTMECQTEMYQFDSREKWLMVGDSNQHIQIEMTLDPADSVSMIGETTIRFEYDQSAGGGRLSQHGLKVSAFLNSGEGLRLNVGVLHFENETEKANSKIVAYFGAGVGDTAKGFQDVVLFHANPVIAESGAVDIMRVNLPALSAQGKLKSGDLLAIGIRNCQLSPVTP